eukprot:1446459-Prymnesium_polylepis.2
MPRTTPMLEDGLAVGVARDAAVGHPVAARARVDKVGLALGARAVREVVLRVAAAGHVRWRVGARHRAWQLVHGVEGGGGARLHDARRVVARQALAGRAADVAGHPREAEGVVCSEWAARAWCGMRRVRRGRRGMAGWR